MKIKRTTNDVMEFQEYVDKHSSENAMVFLINLENESKQLRSNNVDDPKQQAIFEETSQIHEDYLLELQNEYTTIKMQ